MSTSVNRGSQKLTFDFRHKVKGVDFNYLLRNLIKPGIYKGLTLSNIGNTVTISAGDAYFKSLFNSVDVIGTHILFQTSFSEVINQTNILENEVVWLEFTYFEIEQDWADIKHDSVTNFLSYAGKDRAVVLGDLIYTAGIISSIDYSRRVRGSLDFDIGKGMLQTDENPTQDYHVGNRIYNDTRYDARYVNIDQAEHLTNTTESTDKDTGALILDGGIGVEKNINAGGTIKNSNTSASTSKDTGAIVTEGGLGVELNIFAGGKISTSNQLESTVGTGTPPLAISSTTTVTNLNSDMLDGLHASNLIFQGYLDLNLTYISASTIRIEKGSVIETGGQSFIVGADTDLTAANCLGRTNSLDAYCQYHVLAKNNSGTLETKLVLGKGDQFLSERAIQSITTPVAGTKELTITGTGFTIGLGKIIRVVGVHANHDGFFVITAVTESGGNTQIRYADNRVQADTGVVGNTTIFYRAKNSTTDAEIIKYSASTLYDDAKNGHYLEGTGFTGYRQIAEFTTDLSGNMRQGDIWIYRNGKNKANNYFESYGSSQSYTTVGSTAVNDSNIISTAEKIKGDKYSVSIVTSVLRITALEDLWINVTTQHGRFDSTANFGQAGMQIKNDAGEIYSESFSGGNNATFSGRTQMTPSKVHLATGEYIYFNSVISTNNVDSNFITSLILNEVF